MSNSTARNSPGRLKAEHRALLTAAVDGIIIIDSDGCIEEFNEAAEKLFGYGRDEVRGDRVDMLMPEPHRSRHANYIKNYLDTGVAKIIGVGREVEGRRKDGSLFPIWLTIGDANTAKGPCFVGFIRDLTDQRAAEQKQSELESRLEHVARFSLMGEMAAGIAHEINQPLSAITTYAQAGARLLASPDFSHEELQTICNRVAEQGHRAAAVIENLRAFIRKQEPTKELIDIETVVKDVMSLIVADAKTANIPVALEISDGLPQIYGNAVQIQQVLLNLTRNAVDAMRHVRKKTREEGIVIRIDSLSDSHVRIAVIDHGPGVPKGLNDAVFHPFVSTKDDGLGVGLAISRTIVDSHSGQLTYRANPSGGAIFEATFPQVTQE